MDQALGTGSKLRPLRIGLSARFLHRVPPELGFKGRRLQYLEPSVAYWLMGGDALVFMIPSVTGGTIAAPGGDPSIPRYVEALDGLVLQGGADVSPASYGEMPLREEWAGDRVRDVYEIELLRSFVAAGKPVLGICRGLQLVNVAFGGTLYQDIRTQRGGGTHYDAEAYDRNFHDIELVAGSALAALYPEGARGRVNSIHHQAVKDVGEGFVVEAYSVPDGCVEAMRRRDGPYVAGVQWHPEFQDPSDRRLLSGAPLLEEFLAAVKGARAARFAAAAASG